MPPAFGAGNLKRSNRLLRHPSTDLLFIVEDLVDALDTVPSFAMTNFTTIFPPKCGWDVSSRS